MRTLCRILSIVCLGLAACGTGSTSMEQSWRSPTARPGELRRVVTLVPSSNESVRRNAEDQLARKLSARGVQAVPGYAILRQDDLADKDRVARVLRDAGFDGVVTMRFLGREEKLTYDPYLEPYWGNAWDATIPETIVRIEINAYALEGNRLVWSGLSKSVDPNDVSDVIEQVSSVVSRELEKQHLLAKPEPT